MSPTGKIQLRCWARSPSGASVSHFAEVGHVRVEKVLLSSGVDLVP